MGIKADKYRSFLKQHYYFNRKIGELGVTIDFIGFYYLGDIMEILINQGEKVRSFSKQVYPILAQKYNKKECTIERDIRNVINTFWEKSLKEKLNKYWKGEREKPCCQELIYMIKQYIMDSLQ